MLLLFEGCVHSTAADYNFISNYIFQNLAKRIRDKSKSAITLQCTLANQNNVMYSIFGEGKKDCHYFELRV